jgi:hypothetical protein
MPLNTSQRKVNFYGYLYHFIILRKIKIQKIPSNQIKKFEIKGIVVIRYSYKKYNS